jgi:hypothetical protein
MKKIGCVATFKGREQALERMTASISGQLDQLLIYDNEISTVNLTDNGKFAGLLFINEPCYYFTLDDDLIYPPDYVEKMVNHIDHFGCIVTSHGRNLNGLDIDYYNGHKYYSCLGDVAYNSDIDVCGTGVTAFRTDYFNPINVAFSANQRMSDLIFSYYAMKEGRKITMLPHYKGWIQDCDINHNDNIHSIESKQQNRLIQTANEIWKLKLQ